MGLAIVGKMGLDNSAFRAALAASESDVSRTLGRTGAVVKTQIRGVKELSGAVLGAAGVYGLIAGSIVAIGTGLVSAFTYQDRIAQKAWEEARARKEASRALEEQVRDLRIKVGLESASTNAGPMRERMREYEREIEELNQKLATGGFEHGPDDARLLELEMAYRDIHDVLLPIAEELDRIERYQKKIAEQAQLMATAYQLQIDLLRDSGHEEEALQMAEELRYQQQLEALRKLADGNEDLYRQLEAWAKQHHDNTMKRIHDEAEAERTKREEENAERNRRRDVENDIDKDALDADSLRANGRDEEAKILEEKIRLKRQIEAITRAEGLSEEEKARRIRQAQETSRLNQERIHREAQADRDKEAVDARRKAFGDAAGASIESGIARSSLLTRQVFGDPRRDATRDAFERGTKKLDEIKSFLERTVREARSRPMLLG